MAPTVLGCSLFLVTLLLVSTVVQAGEQYVVDGISCTFADAVDAVNNEAANGCASAGNNGQGFDEIQFEPSANSVDISATVVLTKSVQIGNATNAVTFRRTAGNSAEMFHITGDGTQTVRFFSSTFTVAVGPDTQATAPALSSQVVVGYVYAKMLGTLLFDTCAFERAIAEVDDSDQQSTYVGAVFADTVTTFTMMGCDVNGNRADASTAPGANAVGGVLLQGVTTAEILSCSFTENTARSVFVDQANGAARFGGCISIVFSDSEVIDNTSSGAAVFIEASNSAEFMDCFLDGNAEGIGAGGALYIQVLATFDFTCGKGVDCGITNNYADQGGGVYVSGSPSVTFTNLPVDVDGEPAAVAIPLGHNTATGMGGGFLHAADATVVMDGAWSIAGNSAEGGDGGAVCAGAFTSNGPSSFIGNFLSGAEGFGGAVYAENDISITDAVDVIGNTAVSGGGVLCSDNGDVSLHVHGDIMDNTGSAGIGEGGGVILARSFGAVVTMEVVGKLNALAEVSGNSAFPFGGVIFSNGNATLSGCSGCFRLEISGNSAAELGGVIFAEDNIALDFSSDAVFITGNYLEGGIHPVSGDPFAGVGGAFFTFADFDMSGGGVLGANCNAPPICDYGGAIYALGAVDIDSPSLTISDHTVTFDGGAIYAGGIVDATLEELIHNEATRGGGIFGEGDIHINSIANIGGNVAGMGAAFFSLGVSGDGNIVIEGLSGLVDNNEATGAFERGCIAYTSVGNIELSTVGAAAIEDNEGLLVYAEKDATITLTRDTTITGNNGLFQAQLELTINAMGASLSDNGAAAGTTIMRSEGELLLDEPGHFVSNGKVGAVVMESSIKVTVEGAGGDFMSNRGDAIIRAPQIQFTSTSSLEFKSNTADVIFEAADSVIVNAQSSSIGMSGNKRLAALTAASGADCEFTLNGGVIEGNVAPLVDIQGTAGLLVFTAGSIVETSAGEEQKGIFHMGAEDATVMITTLQGGICSNDLDVVFEQGYLVSTSGTPTNLTAFSVSTGDGSMEGNSGAPGSVLFPTLTANGGSSALATAYYGPSQPSILPETTAETALESPLGLLVLSQPMAVTSGEPFSITVEPVTFIDDSISLTVHASVSAGYTLQTAATVATGTDGVATFDDMVVVGPVGTVTITFELPFFCSPVVASRPFPFALPPSTTPTPTTTASSSTTPSATPTPTATTSSVPSPSKTTSPSKTMTVVPTTTPTPTPTVSDSTTQSSPPSSTRTPSPTVSNSKTRTASRSALPSQSSTLSPKPSVAFASSPTPSKQPSFSSTPSGTNLPPPTPLPPVPDVSSGFPSITPPTPTATRTRSPSRSLLPLSTRSCTANCVVEEQEVQLDPLRGDEQVQIVNTEGAPLGSVLLPASAVQPGESLVVGPASPDSEAAAQQLDLGSAVVQITIVDSSGAHVQPTSDIEVCLEVEDADKAEDEGCLSFFDEEREEWVCEDPCLDLKGDTACGTVDHLTNFAVLFTGGEGGDNPCGDDDDGEEFIFSEGWEDGVLVGSFVAAAVLVCIVIALVALIFPNAVGRLHGKEYMRIKTLRDTDATASVASSV